jgi:hypothetical protein
MIKEKENKPDSLKNELRLYCDELTEFNRRCERLCEALADITTHHESISSFSVRGMRHNANWLKYHVNDFSRRLQDLCNKRAMNINSLVKHYGTPSPHSMPRSCVGCGLPHRTTVQPWKGG